MSAGYTDRQVQAARRVLVDVGQVLASFHDSIVVVGGSVPDLLAPGGEPEHIGSIDVDIALNMGKLAGGQYAELIDLLLATGRYHQGSKAFQLATDVDLDDGEPHVVVDVDFLAADGKVRRNRPKRLAGFRALQFAACAAAFLSPVDVEVRGRMISGAENSVRFLVASLPDFLIMKAHAIGRREKAKDVYDLCYCLESPDVMEAAGKDWRKRRESVLVHEAVEILREKFKSVNHYGPAQLANFHGAASRVEADLHARRAFELVLRLLNIVQNNEG